MLIFTHIEIAKHFYRQFNKNKRGALTINFFPFILGSILPDITSMARVNHYYKETQGYFQYYRDQLMDQSVGDSKRSIALGVVCHFLCDYFCKYHVVSSFKEKPLWQHLVYECQLHIAMISGRSEGRSLRSGFLNSQQTNAFQSVERLSERETLDALLSLYIEAEPSIRTDLEFSMFTVEKVLTRVIQSMDTGNYSCESFDESEAMGLLVS